jgi:alkylation response protein AidB-like acyl-CoA dehydrogenase
VRFGAHARTALVDCGDEARLVELEPGDGTPVRSNFMLPVGQLALDARRASRSAGSARRCAAGGASRSRPSSTARCRRARRHRRLREAAPAVRRAIGSFQALQHRLAMCAVQVEATRWLTFEAASQDLPGESAAVAAAYAAEAANQIFREMHQLTGAMGFTREHDLHVFSMRLAGAAPRARRRVGAPARGRRAALDPSDLSLDLALDDAQQAIADAVAKFCAERCPEAVVRETAARCRARSGASSPSSACSRSRHRRATAAHASWSPRSSRSARRCSRVPLAATFLATQVLGEKERARVAQGEWVVALGTPPLLPFAPVADCFLALDGAQLFRAQPRGAITPVETLGGEPWGRVELALGEPLAAGARAFALHDTALAAYAAAAGSALVRATAAHARTRQQFGRAIGEFQAVAHPLADAHVRLEAAATLARIAAHAWDADAADLRARAAAARLSATRAALEAAAYLPSAVRRAGHHVEGPGVPRLAPDPPARVAAAVARRRARRAARTLGDCPHDDRPARPAARIRYERRPDGIAVITLDRPDRGNALAPNMQPVMRAIWARCATTTRCASRS